MEATMKTKQTQEIIKMHIDNLISGVKSETDFPAVYEKLKPLKQLREENTITHSDIYDYLKSFSSDFISNTMLGHSLSQPYGYAGDFEIIDKMYNRWTSDNPQLKIWDEFIQNTHACQADGKKEYKILNLASGPARDLHDVYLKTDESDKIQTTCVDMDPFAIQFGHEVTKDYETQIDFVQKNIFRYTTEEKFDLIWSAGLFDYFDDKTFVRLLKKLGEWGRPGSYIVIGNFNEQYNPTRDVMELLADWHLNHRTEARLTDMAVEAGFSRAAISVGREEQNVNLFLTIRL